MGYNTTPHEKKYPICPHLLQVYMFSPASHQIGLFSWSICLSQIQFPGLLRKMLEKKRKFMVLWSKHIPPNPISSNSPFLQLQDSQAWLGTNYTPGPKKEMSSSPTFQGRLLSISGYKQKFLMWKSSCDVEDVVAFRDVKPLQHTDPGCPGSSSSRLHPWKKLGIFSYQKWYEWSRCKQRHPGWVNIPKHQGHQRWKKFVTQKKGQKNQPKARWHAFRTWRIWWK